MPLPTPNTGESENDFIQRCISFVINEGTVPNTKEGRAQATAMCYSQWRNRGKKQRTKNGKIQFLNSLSLEMKFSDSGKQILTQPITDIIQNADKNGILKLPRSTLLVGDGLYNNIWHPAEELAKSYRTMDRQPFVINHQEGIEHEIGWMEDPIYDSETKKLSAIPILNLNTQYGKTALEFIRNRLLAGKYPETSVSFWATETTESIEQLGGEEKLTAREWEFDHNALVSRGACSPEAGAGIGLMQNSQGGEMDKEDLAEWDTKFINNLPDAAFAYIEPGGTKDEEGKTVPRSLRHFPHHNANVKSGSENDTVDKPHLRNALARAPQSPFGDKALPHLEKHAKALKIGKYAEMEDRNMDKEEKKVDNEEKKVNELTISREEIKAITKEALSEIEKEKDMELRNQKMELLAAAVNSDNLEEAKKYLDLFPNLTKKEEDSEIKKELEDIKKQLATRVTDTRESIVKNEQSKKEMLIRTGKSIMKYAADNPLNIRYEGDYDKIPDSMIKEGK